MDRNAIARAQRRRQAEEALEAERDRMAMLEEQIEDLVTELVGAQVDEETFAAMTPEDVEAVRAILDPAADFEVDDEVEEGVADEWGESVEADPAAGTEEDPAAELEAEIARLEGEIADSRRSQAALQRYLAALGS